MARAVAPLGFALLACIIQCGLYPTNAFCPPSAIFEPKSFGQLSIVHRISGSALCPLVAIRNRSQRQTLIFKTRCSISPKPVSQAEASLRNAFENSLKAAVLFCTLALGIPAIAETDGTYYVAPVPEAHVSLPWQSVQSTTSSSSMEKVENWWPAASDQRGEEFTFMRLAFVDEAKSDTTQATTAQDPQHEIITEALNLVDEHFLDLKNKLGVTDSAKSHIYNGINWDQVRQEINSKEYKDKKEAYKQIEAVLKRLGDKYTRFLDPTEFQKLTKYDVTGVGLLLSEKGGSLYLAAPPLAGSTSAEAGLKKGDRLLTIDGEDVRQGKTPFEGAEMLTGQAGTTVKVEIERVEGTLRELRTVQLVRKISVENPVTTYVVTAKDGSRVGYMKMKEFNAACHRSIVDAVKELQIEQVDSYVLDLRGNLGGVLEGSLEIAGLFMDQNQGDSKRTLVYVMDRNGREEAITAQPRLTMDTKTPIVVLVDKKSASASEVLAGSLHDNCRAVIVGKEHSFGKGLIQGAFPLSDGSGVVLTVAKYLTPKLSEIQGVGVIPDVDLNVGDARKAIKSGKLDLKSVGSKLSVCVPPTPDLLDKSKSGAERSNTDNTLKQLNGDKESEQKESLFTLAPPR